MKIIFTILLVSFSILAFSSRAQTSVFPISTDLVKRQLERAKVEKSKSSSLKDALENRNSIQLPDLGGKEQSYFVVESPVMERTLAVSFPDIKTYKLFGVNNDDLGVLTSSPDGIRVSILSRNGDYTIVPFDLAKDQYEFTDFNQEHHGSCGNLEEHSRHRSERNSRVGNTANVSNGTILRTYRMAIITNGEFYAANGNSQSSAQAVVVSIVNSLRLIYEKEVSVSFTLVATKLYSNSTTDPFNPASVTQALDAAKAFGSLSVSEPASFGTSQYDIGHVLSGSNGGGVAYLGVVCDNYNLDRNTASPIKGGGWSSASPTHVSTFIHEVGHMFNAGHTFNSVNGSCSGNIMTGSAYEPGSGGTYMSYYGGCSPDNVTNSNPNSYFHANSLKSIIDFSSNEATCSVNTTTGNVAPVVNPNPNSASLLVPKGTPFYLNGTGSDSNGDVVLFTWEQYDLGSTRGSAKDAKNSVDSPIFKSVAPSVNGNYRSFPALETILTGNEANNDEALPTVARQINMRLVGRDSKIGGGGVAIETLQLTVTNSGPFLLESQNTPAVWLVGETAEIKWSVNGTNTSPFNVSNVRILFSSDGGNSFPTVLVPSTPNDGSHNITIPDLETSQGRIKIEPVGDFLFFDINNSNITVTANCSAEITSIWPDNDLSAPKGDAALNMDVRTRGIAIPNFSGSLTASSTAGRLSFESGSGGCQGPSNNNVHNTHTFVVTTPGTYTFSGSTLPFGTVLNLYKDSYDKNNVCSNWLTSSGKLIDGLVNLSNYFSETLDLGVYVLVISSFNASLPALPFSYQISYSGGILYNQAPLENSPYAYTYLIKNNSSGNIVSFSDQVDLSNAALFTSAQYTIYGLSYASGFDLNPYVGSSFASFESEIAAGSVCGRLSLNQKNITIEPDCPSTLSLSGFAGSGLQQAATSLSSTQVLSEVQNVEYRAAGFILLQPQPGSGFEVKEGGVFLAEIKNCD